MEEKLKAAVIGCGGAGTTNHIPWYASHPDVELVGLVDINISVAESYAKRWGGRPFNSITEMLDREKPHMVSVATPVHLHAQHAIECMRHGCHVLCEKPMAPTLEECQKMIDYAKEDNVILGIGLDKRFSLVFSKAREIILSGDIGKPLFARTHWVASVRWGGFRTKLYTGGGVFQDCGSHFIDLYRFLLSTEIDTVEGMIDICYSELLEVEDQAVALLRFSNGIFGMIETSWVGPMDPKYPHIEEIWIYGSKGTIKALGAERLELPGVEIWEKETSQWRVVPLATDPETLEHYQYKRMINEFVSCVQEKREFIPSGEDGKKAIEVVLALYQSWYSNEKISLPLTEQPPLLEIFTGLREKSLQRCNSTSSN